MVLKWNLDDTHKVKHETWLVLIKQMWEAKLSNKHSKESRGQDFHPYYMNSPRLWAPAATLSAKFVKIFQNNFLGTSLGVGPQPYGKGSRPRVRWGSWSCKTWYLFHFIIRHLKSNTSIDRMVLIFCTHVDYRETFQSFVASMIFMLSCGPHRLDWSQARDGLTFLENDCDIYSSYMITIMYASLMNYSGTFNSFLNQAVQGLENFCIRRSYTVRSPLLLGQKHSNLEPRPDRAAYISFLLFTSKGCNQILPEQ